MSYTYGSASTCTSNYYECRLGYELVSQNNSNNSSVINLQLQVRSKASSSNRTYGYNQTTTIDGASLDSTKMPDMRNSTDWKTYGTRTITVYHNSNGVYSSSKSGSFKTTATGTYSLKSGSASVDVNLPTIPRYATSNQSLNSKTSSSIKMNWSSDSYIDLLWYSIDNGLNWNSTVSEGNYGGVYNITGLKPNTTYQIKTRVRRKDSELTTDSSTLSVTTYNKTIPTISLSSKTVNSITVTSSCNVDVSSTKYRINGGDWQDSGTFLGLTPNKTYTIEVQKVGRESGESGTTSISLTTYQIGQITSAPNINFGDTANVIKTNPSGATNNLRIETLNPTSTVVTRNNISDNYTVSFTDAEWDILYKKLGNNNSLTIRYVIDTIANGVTYYNYVDRTLTLTGNQKTMRENINGIWKRGKLWVNVNGNWKRAVIWKNVNGTWKRGI